MTEQYIKDYDKQRAAWEKNHPKFEQLVNPKALTRDEITKAKAKLREEKWGG